MRGSLVGRQATSGIKERKPTTFYLTVRLAEALELAHIETQHSLRRRVDKTLFFDALLEAGLKHPEEILSWLGEGK